MLAITITAEFLLHEIKINLSAPLRQGLRLTFFIPITVFNQYLSIDTKPFLNSYYLMSKTGNRAKYMNLQSFLVA